MAHVLAVTTTEAPDALPVPCQKNLHMPFLKTLGELEELGKVVVFWVPNHLNCMAIF